MTNRVLLLKLNGHAMSADHSPEVLAMMRDLSAGIFNDLMAVSHGRDKPASAERLAAFKRVLAAIAASKSK